MCLLDHFGAINLSLPALLQSDIPVRKYLYVEKDETACQISTRHVTQLMQRYSPLLPQLAVQSVM